MIGIYKIKSPTEKVYIGQSINIERRFKTYKSLNSQIKTSIKLHRSLLKYGVEKHIFEVIEECEMSQLNNRERYWQDHYNCMESGLNCKLTKSNDKSGIGAKISDKQKAMISKVHKGKVYSKETRDKIKLARSKQVITQEHKDNISKNSGSAKIVLNLETGIYYDSAKQASRAHNINHNSLVCRLMGRIRNKSNLIYV